MRSGLLAALKAALSSLTFRAIVTACLLWIVLSQLSWASLGEKVLHGDLRAGALALGCVIAALGVGALRWDRILRLGNIALPRRDVARIYAVSSFANAFLPTSIGGDVARPLMVSRQRTILVRAMSTVVVERLVALIALLTLACVGLTTNAPDVATGARAAVLGSTAAVLGALTVVATFPRTIATWVNRFTPRRFVEELDEASTVVRAVLASPRTLVILVLQSLLFQSLVTMHLVFLGRMIGAELSFGLAAVALALVTLATLVPVSIGGFGVREGSYAVVLAGGGVSHTDAILISLLTVLVLFLATLPGAVELVRRGFSPALTPPDIA